jgi:hypothetical protein
MRATLLATAGLVVACGVSPSPSTPPAAGVPSTGDPTAADAERRKAFGYFIDSPRPFEVLDQGLAIAERLARRYGMDSGNPEADRRAAALKFQSEVLERLVFTSEAIGAKAQQLGFSLEPAQCGNTCENVHRLAVFELQKDALEAFADGRPLPGRIQELQK